jgi:integrase
MQLVAAQKSYTRVKGSLASTEVKRGVAFAVKEDRDHLVKALKAMGKRPDFFTRTAYGKPRSVKGASQWCSEKARQAGLPKGRTSHGLRKSRMIIHAENGAAIHEIAAWSGHETLKEIERYTRKANRRRILTPSALETGEFL